jgi:accessory gene regulator B
MKQLANRFTEKLVLYQIIKEEDKDLYTYGIWQGVILLLNYITIITISCFFQMLWQGIIFTVAYGFLRSYAGGYHARTQTRCYLFSMFMIIVVHCLIKFVNWNQISLITSITLSSIAILYMAPMAAENKELDEKEYIVYKKRTKIVLFLLIVTILLFKLVKQHEVCVCITMAICVSSIMLILAKIKIHTRYS